MPRTDTETKSKKMSCYFKPSTMEDLETIADQKDRSLSYCVREAVAEYLEDRIE